MSSLSTNKCAISHDKFCLVCGDYIFDNSRPLTDLFKKLYEKRFKTKFDQIDTNWAPKVTCYTCYRRMTQWGNDETISVKIEETTQWNAPQNHPFDCYFCQTQIPIGVNRFKIDKIQYPITSSVIRAVSHAFDRIVCAPAVEQSLQPTTSSAILVSTESTHMAPLPMDLSDNDLENTAEENESVPVATKSVSSFDSEQYAPTSSISFMPPVREAPKLKQKPVKLCSQANLNDLVRDLNLPKNKAEILTSRLQDHRLVEQGKYESLNIGF